ncbi:MAG TPA: hypothetical protein DEA08_24710, partial [Planctomycetes bacterium]|nr:hypothetical protein [Planctomycetota bacterium]
MSERCEDVRPRLPEFLTGALEDASAAEVEAHLAECGSCAAELGQLLELSEDLGQLSLLPDQAAPEPAEAQVAPLPVRPLPGRRSWRGLALLAAALLVALGLGVLGLGAWRALPGGPRLLVGRLVDEAGQA